MVLIKFFATILTFCDLACCVKQRFGAFTFPARFINYFDFTFWIFIQKLGRKVFGVLISRQITAPNLEIMKIPPRQ